MPKPRALSPAQELEALAIWKAAAQRRGTIAALAHRYGLTWPGMKGLLERVERETKDSRESLNGSVPQ